MTETPRTCSSKSCPSCYNAPSLILTSNLPFCGWGGVFGDRAVAAVMIDRVVHHTDVLTLKAAS